MPASGKGAESSYIRGSLHLQFQKNNGVENISREYFDLISSEGPGKEENIYRLIPWNRVTINRQGDQSSNKPTDRPTDPNDKQEQTDKQENKQCWSIA